MKNTSSFPSRVPRYLRVLSWVLANVALLPCLLWYPLTAGFYGTSFPWLVAPALRFVGALFGGDFTPALAIAFILAYSAAVGEGCLIGIAWAARHRWTRDWIWGLLSLCILIGVQIVAARNFLFGLFSLIGLVALCGQGLGRRHLLLVFALLTGVGLLAFFTGAIGQFLTAESSPSAASPTLFDWVIVIFLEVVVPICLLLSSAALAARRMHRSLQD